VARSNGTVEVRPVQDALVARGEGLIKEEPALYVKTLETNQEIKRRTLAEIVTPSERQVVRIPR
jgi:hypothetical protein